MKKIFSLLVLIVLCSCHSQQKFDPNKWQEKEDPAFPPAARNAMLNDLLKNYKLEQKTYTELTTLLGEPDNTSLISVSYTIIEDYGHDIDPVYIKYLVIDLKSDSSVKKVYVKEWRK